MTRPHELGSDTHDQHVGEVTVFGTDHSPWVQAVLLAMSDRGIAWRLRPFPVNAKAYRTFGLVMPVCQWSDGTLTSDSFAIIAQLQRHCGDEVGLVQSHEADQALLERLFVSYVLARANPGRRLAFVHAWAKKSDAPSSVRWTFLRALLCLYFLALIAMGVRGATKAGRAPFDERRFRAACRHWDSRLQATPFVGGAAPGVVDFALCGHVQCMASGLTDETLPIFAEHPHLVAWLERMHGRLGQFSRLHSRRVFDRAAAVDGASRWQIGLFYVALAWWLLLFPVTTALLLHALRHRDNNPNRTGARL